VYTYITRVFRVHVHKINGPYAKGRILKKNVAVTIHLGARRRRDGMYAHYMLVRVPDPSLIGFENDLIYATPIREDYSERVIIRVSVQFFINR